MTTKTKPIENVTDKELAALKRENYDSAYQAPDGTWHRCYGVSGTIRGTMGSWWYVPDLRILT